MGKIEGGNEMLKFKEGQVYEYMGGSCSPFDEVKEYLKEMKLI